MLIADHQFRFNMIELFYMLKCLHKKIKCGRILQLANMLADNQLISHGKTKGVFHSSPAGKQRRQLMVYMQTIGSKAPRTPQKKRLATGNTADRIIDPGYNLPGGHFFSAKSR